MWSHANPFAIVLCTFNGERFLDEQLCSLRVQDGVAEIIVVDDDSTDATMEILNRHAVEDARIIVSRNQVRLGVTGNFERAIGLARSPWIVLADQDDLWLAGKLARLRACWDGVSDLMHHASRKFRGSVVPGLLSVAAGERRKFHGHDWRQLLHRNTVVGHTTVVRADLVRRLAPFPQDLPHDWWLGLGAAIRGRVQFLDEYLVLYRIHDRNAYHIAGSRYQRLRDEHWLRLGMLQAVLARKDLPLRAEDREFAEQYLHLLGNSTAGTFSWRLCGFYLRHAPVFFGGPALLVSWQTRLRKSIAAALAAAMQPSVARTVQTS